MNEFMKLLIPIALILGGIYLRIRKDKEINAPKNLWIILIILGIISFIVRILLQVKG